MFDLRYDSNPTEPTSTKGLALENSMTIRTLESRKDVNINGSDEAQSRISSDFSRMSDPEKGTERNSTDNLVSICSKIIRMKTHKTTR